MLLKHLSQSNNLKHYITIHPIPLQVNHVTISFTEPTKNLNSLEALIVEMNHEVNLHWLHEHKCAHAWQSTSSYCHRWQTSYILSHRTENGRFPSSRNQLHFDTPYLALGIASEFLMISPYAFQTDLQFRSHRVLLMAYALDHWLLTFSAKVWFINALCL